MMANRAWKYLPVRFINNSGRDQFKNNSRIETIDKSGYFQNADILEIPFVVELTANVSFDPNFRWPKIGFSSKLNLEHSFVNFMIFVFSFCSQYFYKNLFLKLKIVYFYQKTSFYHDISLSHYLYLSYICTFIPVLVGTHRIRPYRPVQTVLIVSSFWFLKNPKKSVFEISQIFESISACNL